MFIWILVLGLWCFCKPLLSARDWTVPWNLGFEITPPRPERALVQVHFSDTHRSPFPGLGEHAAVLTIAKRDGKIPLACGDGIPFATVRELSTVDQRQTGD